MADKKITKVKLSNGQIYSFFDKDAIHYEEGKLVVGNAIIDNLIITQNLQIEEIDDIPIDKYIDNVLTWDRQTGKIKRRSTDILLQDIGGCSYKMDDDTGVLSLKIGKQNNNN